MLIIQNLGWYFHMKKCECGCGMNTKTITSKYYRGHSPNSGFQYGQKNIDKGFDGKSLKPGANVLIFFPAGVIHFAPKFTFILKYCCGFDWLFN